MNKIIPSLLFAAAILLCGCGTTSNGGESASTEILLGDEYYTDLYNYDNGDTFLGRGINMGNYLEAEGGEGEWTNGRLIAKEDFTIIKSAGFKSVRIPVRWADNTGSSPAYTIDAAFMNRVKEVVSWAQDAGLIVVLDVHHYTKMMNEGESALPGHRARLKAIWSQLCDEFTIEKYPADRLVFEFLNEPNGTVTYALWNEILDELITVVRTQKGQDARRIMLGTANWGGLAALNNLVLPASCTKENTIITVHCYDPFQFTHQGAEWAEGSDEWIGTDWAGSDSEQHRLNSLFDAVTEWNSVEGRGFEIFLGEFGVYSKYVDDDCQKAWTAFIARSAEKRKMSWAYWEYDQGLGAYNQKDGKWYAHIYDALIPEEDQP